MQVLKLIILGVLLFVLVRYAPVYYHTTEFKRYVQQQVLQIRSTGILKKAILLNAQQNKLPVKEKNINFTTSDSVLRVDVEYQMPLDLLVFQKELNFSAVGSRFEDRGN